MHDRLAAYVAIWFPAAGALAWYLVSDSPAGIVVAALAIAGAGSLTLWLTRRRSSDLADLQQALGKLAGRLSHPLLTETTPNPNPLAAATEAVRSLERVTGVRLENLSTDLENIRAVFDATASPVLATDAAGLVVLCNRAAEAFFGQEPGGLDGSSVEDLFTHAEILGQHAAALAGKARQSQVRIQRPDGMRVYQVMTSPFPMHAATGSSEKPGVVLTLRDVTELATAVQLKTDFVANASHELRTPLSSIRAAVETLADGAWDDPLMRARLAQMITGNVTRLEEMVRDLLDLSRLESPEAPVQLEPVRLSEIAANLKDVLTQVASERNLKLAFELDPATEFLQTDPRLLTLVCKNLLDNATKFAYEGTTVRLVADAFSPAPARDGLTRDLRIKVIDRGVGIPIGHQKRVFERFFQVDPARSGLTQKRGTGLGLAIVKHAVKALGGTISVESVWKEGTTMTVEVPGCVNGQPSASI